jgi:hypothetical protein
MLYVICYVNNITIKQFEPNEISHLQNTIFNYLALQFKFLMRFLIFINYKTYKFINFYLQSLKNSVV